MFERGDYWQHRCTAADTKVDPLEVLRVVPALSEEIPAGVSNAHTFGAHCVLRVPCPLSARARSERANALSGLQRRRY